LKKLLPSGLVAATVLLAGCYADPTPRGVGSEATSSAVRGRGRVASHRITDDVVSAGLIEVEVEIAVAVIDLNSKDKLKVVVPTTGRLGATEIDLQTVTLGDGRGADTGVLRKKNGGLMARLEDEDGDGDLDLVLHFAVEDLVANGDLTENSTELVLEASTYAGAAVRGSAAVTPRSLEPKTILPPSRIDTSLRIALFRAVPAVWQEV
jgi:hypothetical protein